MSLRDSDDIYVYLSSLAGGRSFPNNTTTEFENRILPIHLDTGRDYEVGLCNILFPKYFYCIAEGDPNSSISFYGRVKQSDFDMYEYNMYTYLPERNIISNFTDKNIPAITKAINGQIVRELQAILNDSFKIYFPYSDIIYYDRDLERVVVNNAIVPPNDDRIYSDISIKFASHIARILGFNPNFRYTVYFQRSGDDISSSDVSEASSSSPIKLFAQYVPRADAGTDYMYVYTDIISPSRFGNQLVNILDVIPLPGDSTSKGANSITYKPLSASTIESVAIKIANQRGKPIQFEDGENSVTCVLHIRPR